MPLDQAVIDWQVIPPAAGARGRRPRGRRGRRPSRHDPAGDGGGATAPGCAWSGIDHSAFGLIRALAGEHPHGGAQGGFIGSRARLRPDGRRSRDRAHGRPGGLRPRGAGLRRRRADGAEPMATSRCPPIRVRGARGRPAVLQPRRRHQPRGRPRRLLRLHPHDQLRRRGHRPVAGRARPASRSTTPGSGCSTSASRPRSRRSKATRRSSPRPARRSPPAPPSSATSCAARSSTTPPSESRPRGSRAWSSPAPAPRSRAGRAPAPRAARAARRP